MAQIKAKAEVRGRNLTDIEQKQLKALEEQQAILNQRKADNKSDQYFKDFNDNQYAYKKQKQDTAVKA